MKIDQREDNSRNAHFTKVHSPLIKRILTSRGVTCDEQLEKSLVGLHPAEQLKGIDEAVELLAQALSSQWRILVVGDFDVDGATSTTLAVSALRVFGAETVNYIVPNRFEYGYGLTPEIIDESAKFSPDLIITVDNGISSIDGVRYAQSKGIKVLVTDHHLAGSELPTADAIVNPNQPDCPFPSKALAGVGVVFYLMVAFRAHLTQLNWFQSRAESAPNLAQFLDLVALGTVADVVPLDHNNRILVDQGIRRMRAGRCRPGILALLDVAKRDHEWLIAADLGFAVGPRLNAAGRLDDMSHGIECLLTTSPDQAAVYAEELDLLNAERKEIERGMQKEALQALDSVSLVKDSRAAGGTGALPMGLVLYDATWHQGIVGILASRIKERYHRPVIAFAEESETEMKGSARSVEGVHIRDVLDAVATAHPGLVTKFGGHSMAAGLSLPKAHLDTFSALFAEEVAKHLTPAQLTGRMLTDGALEPSEMTLEMALQLREFGPWGQHFPEPVFDGRFELLEQRIVGGAHLKFTVATGVGNQVVDGIAFNIDLNVWPNEARFVRLVYRLDINHFRGVRSLQLMTDYLEPIVDGDA